MSDADTSDITFASQKGFWPGTYLFYDIENIDHYAVKDANGTFLVNWKISFSAGNVSEWRQELDKLFADSLVYLDTDITPYAWLGPPRSSKTVRDKWLWDDSVFVTSFNTLWVGPPGVNGSYVLGQFDWVLRGMIDGATKISGRYEQWEYKKTGTVFDSIWRTPEPIPHCQRPGFGWLIRASDRPLLDTLINANATGAIDPKLTIKRGYCLRMRVAKRKTMDYVSSVWQANQRVVDHTLPQNLYILDFSEYDPNTSPDADVPGWTLKVAPPGWKWPGPWDRRMICVLTQQNEFYSPVGGSDNYPRPEMLIHKKSRQWLLLNWIST